MTTYNTKLDENKYNTATKEVIGLSDMNLHYEKLLVNKINSLVANTNWIYVFREININDYTIFYENKQNN